MTSYTPEFLENLRKTGGQLPPDPMLAGKERPKKPMGQVTAAFGANLQDQIKAGKMTTAQAQAAQNAFVKQQVAMRTAPPSAAQVKPAPARELPSQTGFQQSQKTPSVGGIGAPKSSAPYMPSATAPSGPASGPPTTPTAAMRMKKGGKVAKPPVKKMAKGGSVSKRGDGCAVRGKTRGKIC